MSTCYYYTNFYPRTIYMTTIIRNFTLAEALKKVDKFIKHGYKLKIRDMYYEKDIFYLNIYFYK